MSTLDHLDEHARAVVMSGVSERLNFLRRPKWFGYAEADVIFEKLEDLLCHPPTHRMPGLQILGDSNSGKTAIGLEFVERHPVDPNPQGDSIIVPVLRIELPPNPDESRLYDEILMALRQPFRAKDPISEKARQVRATLGIVSCRMLIIDEFQHVLAPRNDRQRILINAIKHLSNTLQIPIVVIGTSEAQVAVSKDEQLTNRLYPMWMPNWKLDREYRRLLASFEVTMPLRERSHLQDKHMAALILELSEGLLGEVRDLLCMGCEHALKAGREQVDIELIRILPWIPRSRRRSRRMPTRV
jgi:hypothetical protein